MITTADLLRTVGLLPLLTVIALAAVVLTLRLVALPLAGTALLLDALADRAARPLAGTAADPDRGVVLR